MYGTCFFKPRSRGSGRNERLLVIAAAGAHCGAHRVGDSGVMIPVKELIRAVTSRLPLRGLPLLFDPFGPVLFRPPSPARLRLGDIDLDLDLSNRLMRTMYFGIFEKELLAYLRLVLRPGDTFVDVGANIGYVSAFARQLVGTSGMVYCFEPVPDFAAV
jgi:hypothetical protein